MSEEADYLNRRGGTVHYDLRGPEQGELLVLLPPLGGSGELFAPFRDDLATTHRVLTCEPPGSGASSPPQGLPSTRGLASDVLELLQSLGVESYDLFGISLGGMVAQWMAIDAPHQVRRLVLASTSARHPSPSLALTREALALAGCLVAAAEPALALVEEIVSDATLADDAERARIEAAVRAHPAGRAVLLALVAAAAAHDTQVRIRELRCPTLVVSGSADSLVPAALQAELANGISGAIHRYVEGAEHDVTIDRPKETAALVRAFLGDAAG